MIKDCLVFCCKLTHQAPATWMVIIFIRGVRPFFHTSACMSIWKTDTCFKAKTKQAKTLHGTFLVVHENWQDLIFFFASCYALLLLVVKGVPSRHIAKLETKLGFSSAAEGLMLIREP